jgi:hypothetical protein
LRLVLVVLLAIATLLFVMGSRAEKSSEPNETPTEHARETGNEAAERATSTHSEPSETVLGLHLESTGAQIAAVLVSLAAIAALLFTRRREWLYAVAAFSMLFAVLDVAEVTHQADKSDSGLAALAAFVACLHLAVALGAFLAAKSRSIYADVDDGDRGRPHDLSCGGGPAAVADRRASRS